MSFDLCKEKLIINELWFMYLWHMWIDQQIEIDWFTALHRCVCMQKLSHVLTMTMWLSYISCSACAKTLLSFCVYEQRLCCVFAVYVIAMHVSRFNKAKNRSIYCITWVCMCAKAESCLHNVYVCDVYELQRVRKDVAVILCIWAKTVSCFRNVCDCNACTSIW